MLSIFVGSFYFSMIRLFRIFLWRGMLNDEQIKSICFMYLNTFLFLNTTELSLS